MLRTMYKCFLRPFLFLIEPEKTHELAISAGRFLGAHATTRRLCRTLFDYEHPSLEQTVCGLQFNNPVGLAAGFDKDAQMLGILPAVGFGHIEVGTVTLLPYGGNPQPRLARLRRSRSLVVNYGLKNAGVRTILANIRNATTHTVPLAISVGKSNSKTTADAVTGIEDYAACFKAVMESDLADFHVLNISCPNTFGGEPFTTPELLGKLLTRLEPLRSGKPLFLKMPINLPWVEFSKLLDCAISHRAAGVIIGNLNKNRNDPFVKDSLRIHIPGSLSGLPTKHLSNELIADTWRHYGKNLLIIGTGGIFSAEDAYEKIRLGASLVQLITGMIYEGPKLIGDLNRGLVRLLERDGYTNISQAVGAAHR